MKKLTAFLSILLIAACGGQQSKWRVGQSYYGFHPGEYWESVSNRIAGLLKDDKAVVTHWINKTAWTENVRLNFFLDNPNPEITLYYPAETCPADAFENAYAKAITLRFMPDASTNYVLAAILVELSSTNDILTLQSALTNKYSSREPSPGEERHFVYGYYETKDRNNKLFITLKYYKSGSRIVAPQLAIIHPGLANELGN